LSKPHPNQNMYSRFFWSKSRWIFNQRTISSSLRKTFLFEERRECNYSQTFPPPLGRFWGRCCLFFGFDMFISAPFLHPRPQFYLELRKRYHTQDCTPITTRQLESRLLLKYLIFWPLFLGLPGPPPFRGDTPEPPTPGSVPAGPLPTPGLISLPPTHLRAIQGALEFHAFFHPYRVSIDLSPYCGASSSICSACIIEFLPSTTPPTRACFPFQFVSLERVDECVANWHSQFWLGFSWTRNLVSSKSVQQNL